MISCIIISGLNCIILYSTHSPSEKVYSADRQYSYYFKEYNYNVIRKIFVPSFFYETKRKVFIYDEVKQKKLYSRYVGGYSEYNDYFGFFEERNRFHFSKPDYYKLPRPIDEEAIKRKYAISDSLRLVSQKKQAMMQKQEQEKAIRDSICWEQAKAEFYNLPAITQAELEEIQPVIKKWTDYHKIDFSQAKFVDSCMPYFNSTPFKGVLYREFTSKEDSPSRTGMTYSPDKQRYIDISIWYKTISGKQYYKRHSNSDIYLIDRTQKHQNCLFCAGFHTHLYEFHDVFWLNNDVFIVVGFNKPYRHLLEVSCGENIKDKNHLSYCYAVYVFDINNSTIKEYGLPVESPPLDIEHSYFEEYLKERGIMFEKEDLKPIDY